MSEAMDQSPNNDVPNEPDFFSLYRPSTVERANKLAQEIQNTLNAMEGDEELLHFSREEAIRQLDIMCGHVGELLVVSGDVWANRPNLSVGITDGIIESTRTLERLNDHTVQSLGYIAYQSIDSDMKNRFDIRLVANEKSEHIGGAQMMGFVTSSAVLEIPTDGSVDVKLLDEDLPSHVDLLRYYMPELVEKLTAIFDEKDTSLTKKLSGIRKLQLEEHPLLSGRGGEELRKELLKYLNERLERDMNGFHQFAGTNQMYIINNGRVALLETDGAKTIGPVNGLVYISKNDARIAVSSVGYVENVGWHVIHFPLSRHLHVTPNSIIEVLGDTEGVIKNLDETG